MATIEKNKKYMLQFPEHVTTDKQEEYLKKLDSKLQTDRFVVVDSKIKVFPASESIQTKDEEEKNDVPKTGDNKEPTGETKTEEGKETKEANKTTEKTPETKPEDDKDKKDSDSGTEGGITIDKVEAPMPKKEEASTAFDEVGSSGKD